MADLRTWQRDIIEAAWERDWVVLALDARDSSITIEEPVAMGIRMRLSGATLSPEFVRRLPLAGMPPVRTLVDESPCWCRFDNPGDAGHESKCLERRSQLA